ncbi:MAG: hypothetical protein L3J57_12375 [Desulfuromusa sp.]|nr:hypothetical protein [Desulfuromusa sp.]
MKLSQQMTFLGLAVLTCCTVLLITGGLSSAAMPQFLVTAFIFLSSGRLIRNGARKRTDEYGNDGSKKKPHVEPNWALRTQILNWGMTVLIICTLGLWVMKPAGVPFLEFLQLKFFFGVVDHEAGWRVVSQIPPP